MAPDSPLKTCSSERPCSWEWYQYRPGGISGGTGTSTAVVELAGMLRRTLSAMPDGEVWKPWKWMFVASSRPFTSSSRMVSPGERTIVGPG